MSKHHQQRAHCLCGSVQMDVIVKKNNVHVCHCSTCRRWGGGPLFGVHSATAPSIKDNSHVRIFSSSDWAERGFCENCGTHLFYRLKDQVFYVIPMGLFDKTIDWPLETQVFIDEKPANYNFAEKTIMMTGQDVFNQSSS